MTEQKLRAALARSLTDEMPAETRMAVLNKIRERKEPVVKSKLPVAIIFAIVLTLFSGVALAFSLSREYFEDVARIEFESGEYIDWGLKEKRIMVDLLTKYNLITAEETGRMNTEEEIDTYMLDRYGFESAPHDLSAISLTRIAWVEMGPYTDWDNETWVWYTDMMFEVGLWTADSDVDVYLKPGDEAIPPEKAIHIASQELRNRGISGHELEHAKVFWHYMTHASDLDRKDIVYLVTFRYADQSEDYVFLTPDGQVK